MLIAKLGAILEIYEMFVGDDPRHVPMRIFPGVHYSMGGLWVDYDQRTNIPGLFAAGECDYSIHGANRLGANSLVQLCLWRLRCSACGNRVCEERRARRHEAHGLYDSGAEDAAGN